jgi:DNA-binding PadR family transcriptional regulator
MDVKTLCLGVLTEGDRTGYEIKQRFEEAFNHFFGAGFGSIYPALAQLSRDGLVTLREVEQDKRPDKKVYHLTEAGHRALIAELMATPPRHKVRSEFLVLMNFAHLLPPGQIAAIIDAQIAQWEGLRACCAACVADPGKERPLQPGERFAAGYGQVVIEAALAFVRAHRDQLVDEVAASRTGPPASLAAE